MAKLPFLNMEKEFNEKMNVLMTLSNPFTPDPRVYNEAKSLIKAGHKVTIITWDKKRKSIDGYDHYLSNKGESLGKIGFHRR